MTPSDSELMVRIQSADRDAFEVFSARHERTLRLHLLRYVDSQDVEDLAQEAMVRVWDRAEQWSDRGAPLAWLLRIATNLALNYIRDQRMKATVSLSEAGDAEDDNGHEVRALELSTASADELAYIRHQASRLAQIVSELPEDRQDVLRRSRLEGMKLQDIAAELDVPLGTVKSRLHLATKWVTQRWEDEQ